MFAQNVVGTLADMLQWAMVHAFAENAPLEDADVAKWEALPANLKKLAVKDMLLEELNGNVVA
eukprot:11133597-Prorocentrum_lima.AAC.1